jgi:hypothetical protein
LVREGNSVSLSCLIPLQFCSDSTFTGERWRNS